MLFRRMEKCWQDGAQSSFGSAEPEARSPYIISWRQLSSFKVSWQSCVLYSHSRKPEFESPLLLFRRLGNCVLSTMPQLTQLYKNKYAAIDSGGNARNCSLARMVPREVELVSEWTGLPGVKCKPLWAVQRWILHYILTYFYLYRCYLVVPRH